MLKQVLQYTGRLWINRLDPLVGKAKNGRYYRKYRLAINNGQQVEFKTLTVFAEKASELFSLPESLVVYNLPITDTKFTANDREYTVYATELSLLLQHSRPKQEEK